jgi:pimeloyl-ACP methyl ester carboxylesterase
MSYCCNVAVVVGTGDAEPVLSWLMVPVRAQGLSISPGLLLTCLWPNAAYRLRMRPSCGGCSAIHTGVRKGPARFARVAALADPGNRRSWPLLLIAASEDRTTTSSMVKAMYRKHSRASSRTDIHEFPNRSHWLIAEPGWDPEKIPQPRQSFSANFGSYMAGAVITP